MDVLTWAHRAPIGEVLVYATSEEKKGEAQKRVEALHTAMIAHLHGLVFLSQKIDRKTRHRTYRATRLSNYAAKKLGIMA